MDWIAALCLSVPPSAALVLATRLARGELHRAAAALGYALKDGASVAATRLADALDRSALELADAHVRAARYSAGLVKPRPKKGEPEDPHPFDLWLADGGAQRDENVQNRVAWAFDRLQGMDAEQGTAEKAAGILATDAPGYEAAMRQWIDRQAKRAVSA